MSELRFQKSERIVAIIPARGGSKRIANKNLRLLTGKPLIVHSIEHALRARRVTEVVVSTEDPGIVQVAESHGAKVVLRPPALATDDATSEAALLHVLDTRAAAGWPDPDLVVFLQCTSPVRETRDIDRAVATLEEHHADSLFSACTNNRLIWAVRESGPCALNYDFRKRQREQDMAVQYRENGSIYVFKPEILRRTNNRLGGKIAIYEMDYWSSFQIDEPEHLELIEWILSRKQPAAATPWPARIDLIVFDFDGVMTDNRVLVREDGAESVTCHRGDGWGVARLRDAGIRMIVLSTETNEVVAARCAKLKIECHHGVENKGKYLSDLLARENINPAHLAYVGNDLNDLDCFQIAGFPVAVADAHPTLLKLARLVLTHRGGEGAVREFCDHVRARLGRGGGA